MQDPTWQSVRGSHVYLVSLRPLEDQPQPELGCQLQGIQSWHAILSSTAGGQGKQFADSVSVSGGTALWYAVGFALGFSNMLGGNVHTLPIVEHFG